jgi:outer membrane protein TolC
MDSIDLVYHPDKNELTGKLFKQNTSVLSVSKQLDVAKLSTKEMIAQRYPWISFLADYNYLQTNATFGTTLKNRSYGPLVGGTLTLPIYYGHKITTQIKVSRLEQQSVTYVMNDTKNQVYTQLQNSLSDYDHIIQLLTLEKANTLLARENLSISMQRLRLGQTTSLEVRQAEESYSESLNRLIQFKYSAKVSETRLRQLVSEL